MFNINNPPNQSGQNLFANHVENSQWQNDHLVACDLGSGNQKVQFHAIGHVQGVRHHRVDFLEQKYHQGGSEDEGTLDSENHAGYFQEGYSRVDLHEDLPHHMSLEVMDQKNI